MLLLPNSEEYIKIYAISNVKYNSNIINNLSLDLKF